MSDKKNKGTVKYIAHEVEKTVEVVSHVKWIDFEPIDMEECEKAPQCNVGLTSLERWRIQKFKELHQHSDIVYLENHISIYFRGSFRYCYCDYCHVESEITDMDEFVLNF